MLTTAIFEKNIAATKRIVVNEGGSGSSKTLSALQKEYCVALLNQGILTSVVSETMPHIKRGAERTFIDILERDNLYDPKMHNMTDHTFHIGKSKIEFFSADQHDKVVGPRRDRLFVNEANHIGWETFRHMLIRTNDQITLDYNPEGEFWVHNELMPNMEHDFIHSTHLDNPYLAEAIRKEIVKMGETDPYFNQVYVKGLVGVLKGAIFTNWIQEQAPMNARLIGYGNDFGYVNDPTAVIKVSMLWNSIYLEEVIYERGLVNIPIKSFNGQQVANIHDRLLKAGVQLRHDLIVADSAEQKSISELYHMGWNIHAARKTSINAELDKMRRFKICIHPESVNLIKEFRNYKWEVDKNGISLNKPVDAFNHGIDAARYLINFYLSRSPGITIH